MRLAGQDKSRYGLSVEHDLNIERRTLGLEFEDSGGGASPIVHGHLPENAPELIPIEFWGAAGDEVSMDGWGLP